MSKFIVQPKSIRLPLPPEGFCLAEGGVLRELEVAYETYGSLSAACDNAIFICSHLTSDAHVAGYHAESDQKPGWWDDMIGPGKPIDTNRWFVIASNMLGGCKGTTGPLSLNPETGRPYGADFPRITMEDIVRVQRLLVEALGVDALEAVVGSSMGGMQALQWCVSFPDKVRKCIGVATAANLSAMALGFEIIGRKVIVNDPRFHEGNYYAHGCVPRDGLGYARMIGHLTYLSAVSMNEKFGRQMRRLPNPGRFETGFAVETYLDHQAEVFINRFDANSYLHITWAMDHFDLAAKYGSLENALAPCQAEFLLVALSSDWLFPLRQTHELAQSLLRLKKVVTVAELNSPYGHDAFLLEVDHLSQVIHGFLERAHFTASAGEGGAQSQTEAVKPPAPSQPRKIRSGHTAFKKDTEFEKLMGLIAPESHILDIGCGDGSLIDRLWDWGRVTGVGVDINLESVFHCLRVEVPVLQMDADKALELIDDGAFDFAVLNRTLPVVRRPVRLLHEMVRVARKGIVSFPNFGHWKSRLQLGLGGRMPVSRNLPFDWHNTPNIHLFCYSDFVRTCQAEGLKIERIIPIARDRASAALCRAGLVNLGADSVIALVSRGEPPRKEMD